MHHYVFRQLAYVTKVIVQVNTNTVATTPNKNLWILNIMALIDERNDIAININTTVFWAVKDGK